MKTKNLVLDRFIDLTPLGPEEEQGIIQIYKAFHIHRLTEVLLKVASRSADDSLSDFIEAQNRLCLEAQATQRVNHPNVVRVIDSSAGPTVQTFVALEYLEGENLAQYLENYAPMSAAHVLEIAIPLADAIDAAHRAGVIHGDIKPSNVMLVSGIPTLIDFGCSFCQIFAPFRPAGRPIGTYAYMCPTYLATAVLTERSDIYSFGVMLYEMLTGFNPLANCARSLVSDAFDKSPGPRRKKVAPLTKVAPAVPRELAREIHRAMARNPAHRHGSMAELLSALESQQRRLASIEPIASTIALGDQYATAGCGIAAMARAIDKLAEDQSTPVPLGQGTGFGRNFFRAVAVRKALEGAPIHALPAHEPSSSLERVFAKADPSHPLFRVKARNDAVTVPGLDPKSLASCAATFSTPGFGTAAMPSATFRASARSADLCGPDTLPLGSRPDGLRPASRPSLAGSLTLEAVRAIVDPATAIQIALATEANPTPTDATVRSLGAETPPHVKALAAGRRKATFHAPTRPSPTEGPDTRPMGTLIIWSSRTTTPSQVAVARRQELQPAILPGLPPEPTTVAVGSAVRIAQAHPIAAEAPSAPQARRLALVSGDCSRPSALDSKAIAKDTRVYAGVPIRRPTTTEVPFAAILAEKSRADTAMTKTLGMVAFAASVLIGFFSMYDVAAPNVSASRAPSVSSPPPAVVIPPMQVNSVPVPATAPPPAPVVETPQPPEAAALQPAQPSTPVRHAAPSKSKKSHKYAEPVESAAALRMVINRKQAHPVGSTPTGDPGIVDPWGR